MENDGRRLGVRKGAWTKEEDDLLKKCVANYGEGKWHQVPLRAGLNRCRKSCRLRWLNYLRPNIKRGYFTKDEVDLIIRLHKLLGNRWSLIAGRLPGRTANDVKNFWNTNIYKNNFAVAVGGGETESYKMAKTLNTDQSYNIIRPRPRTFPKLQLPVAGCPSTTGQPTKTNINENPKDKLQRSNSSTLSLSQDQDTINDRTNINDPDECIRWWSNLLEITESGEQVSLSFSDEHHQIIFSAGLGDAHANVYTVQDGTFSNCP